MKRWPGLALAVVGAFCWSLPKAAAIDDLLWLHPDADRLSALTRHPAECVVTPEDGEEAYLFQVGRVAFRSPFLLGGLAARSSMRCQTCHINGHGNPDFFVEGFSREPGTADATSHLFSHTRGDGVFNPVVIPTLVDIGSKQTFGTMAPTDSLDAFVASVIVEEFQGRAPGNVVLKGLLRYLRSLRGTECPEDGFTAVTFEEDVEEVRAIHQTVLESQERQYLEVADFALVSLGAALGRIRRQFPIDTEAPERLVKLAMPLQQIRPLLREDQSAAREALVVWRAQLEAGLPAIVAEVPRSYYNAKVLAERLAR